MRDNEDLATAAIDCGLRIHRGIGPGMLESVYETLMADQLKKLGFAIERQKSLPITFDGLQVPDAFKADLLIESTLLIELKSVEQLSPVHAKQTLTYLRMIDQPLGLLMNFGAPTFKEGLRRIVNNHVFASSRLRVNQSTSPHDATE